MKGSELKMKHTKEEILNALRVIKETCEEYEGEFEDYCPLYSGHDLGCLVTHDLPYGWKINDESLGPWKGLL